MTNAVLAVIGAALLVWAITAWREKARRKLAYRQALGLTFFKFVFGLRVQGLDTTGEPKGPILYLVSRQSRLDRMLLRLCLPRGTYHAELSARTDYIFPLVKSVLEGRARICLYGPRHVEPDEDALERLRRLGRIARDTGAIVVAVHVRGSGFSVFSDWDREMAPRGLLPQITVTAAPPRMLPDVADVQLADALLDGLALARFHSFNLSLTLFEAVVGAARQYGASRGIVEDAMGGRLSYRQVLIGARALGVRFAAISRPREAIGVMLPNANGLVVAAFALFSAGRPAAMLNYSAGPATIVSAIGTAAVRTVISSRAFIEKAGLEEIVERIKANGTTILYLEDLRVQISTLEKVRAFVWRRKPIFRSRPDDPVVIQFTSGSEGTPKGVVLSSANLLANAAQASCRVDISPVDSLFNVLPLFHSFGLLGGMVLPLLSGVRLYLYPSPLHYKIIPTVARKIKPTIMFGTDTFLTGYGRSARDGDFGSVRMIVAGAEAVRPETRRLFAERFGVRIVEGYGMTETSPVVAVNSAVFSKDGSVGRLLPGMEMRIEPVDGFEQGGMLSVSGPNVMLGYLNAEEPGVLQVPAGKWHETGDIVVVDERGFITIVGRARRFAKIAGEMISLGAVEILAANLWPEADHAAVAVPDSRRGERIVLLTTQDPARRDELIAFSRRYGATDLLLPADILQVETIPLLGSGKVDYPGARNLALSQAGA